MCDMVYFILLKGHFGGILRVKEHETRYQEITRVTQVTDNNGCNSGDEGGRLFGDIFWNGSCSVNILGVFSPALESLSDILIHQYLAKNISSGTLCEHFKDRKLHLES